MITVEDMRFRAAEREDIPRFVRWLNDPEVRQNLLLYAPMSLHEEEEWFNGLLKRPKDERPMVIEVNTPDGWQPIGNIGLHNIEWRIRSAEVGLFIGEKTYWGHGFGSRALRMMVDYAFNTLNLNRIFLHVFETNARGIRAYQKVGFVEEGRLRQDMYKDGRYIDVLMMSILRQEWHSNAE
ncbi:MAG: GNAT family protein [Chloroflexota bacterium]|jgi:RimJ/RimL family protein N-acetyltransferase